MKRLLLFLAATTMALSASAQQPPKDNRVNPRIEELVSDLSAAQKTRIDVVTRRSKKNIDNYRQQLKAVRDSIRSYMDTPDDHSDILFPLYELEGKIQAEISKEYYRTKIDIDKVLTPEQYNELKTKMEQQRANKKGHKRAQHNN